MDKTNPTIHKRKRFNAVGSKKVAILGHVAVSPYRLSVSCDRCYY